MGSVGNNTNSESVEVENNVQRSGEFPTKFFQKYVVIEETSSSYRPYYDNGVDDMIQGPSYSKSRKGYTVRKKGYTKSEVKKDFIQELKDRFL